MARLLEKLRVFSKNENRSPTTLIRGRDTKLIFEALRTAAN